MQQKPYCGSGNCPKNKKKGSPEQCLKQGQVRLYGIEKIDETLIENKKEMELKRRQIKTLTTRVNTLL